MHEWALAEGVLTTALDASQKEGITRIKRIVVSIGQLQQISTGFFETSLKEVMPANEPKLKDTEIDLQLVEAVFKCRVCSNEFTFTEAVAELSKDDKEAIHFIPELSHTFFHCTNCGSSDFEVIKGRGVWIERIEGEQA